MIELQELKYQLIEEQRARQTAELLLEEKNNDLFIAARNVAEMALFTELNPYPRLRFDISGALQLANPAAINLLGPNISADSDLILLFPEAGHLNIGEIVSHDEVIQVQITRGEYHFEALFRGVSKFGFLNVYLNDITDLKKVKEKLAEERTEVEQLIDSISSILIGLNPEGVIARVNRIAETTLGIQTEDVKGVHIDESPILWSLGTFELISEMLENQTIVALEEAMFRNGEGQEGFIDVTITKILNAEQEKVGYLILARDVTERKHLEQQLLQAQKLESLGQLAAGIAHEINTPIQFIGDNTHFLANAFSRIDKVLEIAEKLQKGYQDGEQLTTLMDELESTMRSAKIGYMRREVPAAIEESIKGLDQVASIVRGMKQFAHPGSGGKKLADINSCLQNTITVSRNEWKYVADLETDLCETLPNVLCDANEINQVFLNMIVNAAHAIEAANKERNITRGKITIRTAVQEDTVLVEISDTGTGIPQDILHRIYDPFFTTKEPGKGTGQGLAIAFNVIKKHEGSIIVDSSEGEGTTFCIRLPAQNY